MIAVPSASQRGLDALDDEYPFCAMPADHAPRLVPQTDNAAEAKLTPNRVSIADADQRSVVASLPDFPRASTHREMEFMTVR